MTFDADESQPPALGRRGFLGLGLGAAVAAVVPPVLLTSNTAEAAVYGGVARRLSLHNINTGEHFSEVFWADGKYRPDALKRLDVLLRDHRAKQVHRYDPRLFDVLWQIQQRLESQETFQVVSAFRSKKTNALARRRSRAVAKESYHTRGMAVDVVLPGRDLHAVAQEAMRMQAGGVGYYPRSGFVHVDTGPVRHW